ncbi:flagellar FliJ family protein [Arthrobacter sp. H20]|uniref:flagellar FliJ family protein n=1 Tax=Arthrobacter sp. H20 TaxID=1267981 RepID=UPI000479BC53|nr:flagellar FliJ family protein [Arthrobacter sp. H20]
MARAFPLAGLLRLRRIHQDQAAGELAAANAAVRAREADRGATMGFLDRSLSRVDSAQALSAVAAARASSRSMLRELEALETRSRADLDRAQAEFSAARARTISLEKLEERHTAAVQVEDLRTEQLVLDEIATNARPPRGKQT